MKREALDEEKISLILGLMTVFFLVSQLQAVSPKNGKSGQRKTF